jgi:hypothetical protein
MKNINFNTTNWDRFGIYNNIPANTERVKKAGKVFVILPGGKRVLARTEEDRKILRRAVNSLRKVEVVSVQPKPVTYKVRLVKARIKVAGGKTLNRVCKVVGSDGTKKMFVTKKAAMAWVKNQK